MKFKYKVMYFHFMTTRSSLTFLYFELDFN